MTVLSEYPLIQTIFGHSTLNHLQAKVFERCWEQKRNVVVSAPTGTGKTGVMEIAICGMLNKCPSAKAIYVAPTRALCTEREGDWSERFQRIRKECKAFIGDTSNMISGDIM